MATPQLKKHLTGLSHEELVKHLVELDKRFKPVQEYFNMIMGNNMQSVIERYKQDIEYEFFPARGLPKMRLSVARKAITEANKLGLSPVDLADLRLYYVETGVRFTLDFGDMDESFYNSMESMYRSALELIARAGLQEIFVDRAQSVVDNTEVIGWGFQDTLSEMFETYFR